MKRIIILLLFFIISKSTYPQQYLFDVLVGGIREPTAFAFLPNGNVIVNQKHDSTKIYNITNGQLISCFWNFRDSLYDNPETGLIGVCIDPNFNSNHYVYILYTDRFDSTARVIRFTEVNNIGTNPFIVTKFRRNGSNFGGPHLAGNLKFGPLNKLYISIGEAGQSSNAQLLTNPLGKILRINSNGTIPTDNPFYDDGNPLTGNDDRIWAYGLRNSYDFCFSPINDSLYAAENNFTLKDEFNYIIKGKNYGWPVCQGFCNNPLYKNPLDTLPNSPGNGHYIPTGMIVYNGSAMPELYGKLLIGGYAGSLIKYNLGNAPAYDTIIPPYTFVRPFGGTGLTTVLQGAGDFIYYAAFHPTNGSIVRIRPNPNGINNNGSPVNFSLSQNYPNPFNPQTSISYSLLKHSFVSITIFDVTGREIETLVNENKAAGKYEAVWNAANHPSGVYFYRLTAEDFSEEKKMVLLK